MDLAKLKTEITTDPQSLGYAGKDDEQIAAILNTPTRQINRETITGGQLAACVKFSEFTALAANEKDWLKWIGSIATPITITTQFRNDLGGLFPAGSATRIALTAMVKRSGTRAEELDLGGQPTASDVANAKRS